MSVITKGRIFSNGEQLTAEKLNVLVDEASFDSSTAVDNSTTRVSSSGAITVKPQGITSTELAASERWQNAYPIGSIYINASNSTNPSTLLGFGTWAAFGAGRVLVGIDSGDTDFDSAEETGGAKTHTLTNNQMPSHSHLTVGSRTTNTTPTSSNSIAVNSNQSSGNNDYILFGGGTQTSGITNTAGNGESHNNLQPYIVVYMWKRTA
jgi:hypothetical protein